MRRFGLLGAALVCAAVATVLARRRFTRIAVSGHSMAPGLRDGDWLLIDQRAPAEVGDIVVVGDPSDDARVIIKRVQSVGTDFQLMLESDHPAHSGERIGPVKPSAVLGRAWLRYWPPERMSLIQGQR